jgi:nicotinate phosphoribosyltransferase
MRTAGHALLAVRLESGDLALLSRQVREIFDAGGLSEVRIFASGGLDEFSIQELLAASARIDAFGVGTRLGVSADAPYLDTGYKMVEYAGRPVLKLSSGKISQAGVKQVFRLQDDRGLLWKDLIGLHGESVPEGEPLLQEVMKEGKRLLPPEPLDLIRKRFLEEFGRLPETCKKLRRAEKYPVEATPRLQALQEEVTREIRRKELGGD